MVFNFSGDNRNSTVAQLAAETSELVGSKILRPSEKGSDKCTFAF